MDQLDCIRTFQMVADCTSFAEAARKMRITAVSATRAVASLEKSLGVTLLTRTTRSVRLTKQGTEYLERTRRALHDLDDAGRVIRGEHTNPRGQLVMTAPVSFGQTFVMPIVAEMLSSHPELSMRVILADRVMRLAEEGIDFAVRIGHLPDSALRATRLATVRQVWAASPEYLSSRGVPKALEELSNHDLIHFDTVTLNKGSWLGQKAIQLEPRLRTDSADASIEAAVNGMGIARLFSYHVRRQLAEGLLVRVLPEDDNDAIPVNVVYQASRPQTAGLRAFLLASTSALPECPEL
jgi:DNA-binding transcriptional LysR family regulator